MQLLYALCLVLPLCLVLRQAFGVPETPVAPSRPTAGAGMWSRLVLLGIVVAVLAYCAALAWLDRFLTFDDAFMSYRYARHLGAGFGLVWNPGEAPVEGFTNLLLVVMLAPFTRMGLDPLAVTRVLSILAAAGLTWIVWLRSRDENPLDVAVAVAATWLAGNLAFSIAMVGLETVIFTALLFFGFHLVSRWITQDDRKALRAGGVVLFLALLTRPEAAILAVIVSFGIVALGWRDRNWRQPLLDFALSFWAPVAAYLLFKLVYFGGLLPNPAWIKVGQDGLLAEGGVTSVREFLMTHWKWLVVAAAASLLPCGTRAARVRLLAGTYLVAHVVFYLRVDTLMDIYGRFLFPAAPFLFELARPLFERAHRMWLDPGRGFPAAVVAGAVFFFVAIPNHDGTLTVVKGAAKGESNFAAGVSDRESRGHSWSMRQKSKLLGEFPGIESVTMASVDAGVLAYDSRVIHVDTVGLNDRFIARHEDIDELTGYLFGRKPDLILQRARIDGTLVTYGHGILGDTSAWSTNPGWDDYVYAGSITDVEPWRHEMHVYVRRDGAKARELLDFLRSGFIDRIHPAAPVPLGTKPQALDL